MPTNPPLRTRLSPGLIPKTFPQVLPKGFGESAIHDGDVTAVGDAIKLGVTIEETGGEEMLIESLNDFEVTALRDTPEVVCTTDGVDRVEVVVRPEADEVNPENEVLRVELAFDDEGAGVLVDETRGVLIVAEDIVEVAKRLVDLGVDCVDAC